MSADEGRGRLVAGWAHRVGHVEMYRRLRLPAPEWALIDQLRNGLDQNGLHGAKVRAKMDGMRLALI